MSNSSANQPGKFLLDIKLIFSGEMDWRQIAKFVIILFVIILTLLYGGNLPPLAQLIS